MLEEPAGCAPKRGAIEREGRGTLRLVTALAHVDRRLLPEEQHFSYDWHCLSDQQYGVMELTERRLGHCP